MDPKLVKKLKPYVLVLLLQFGGAGFCIVAKAALNQGSSHFVFAVYRSATAAVIFLPFAFILDRKIRPRMTLSIFIKILLLSLLDPVIGRNAFYAGMKYSTATVAGALCNIIPAITLVMAWILRIEEMKFKEIGSHAKLVGTLVTVGGATIMTLVNGPALGLPWTHKSDVASTSTNPNDGENLIKGSIMIIASCTCYSGFFILQSITLKSYPPALSLTAIVCTLGALIGALLTFIVERENTAVWALGWDAKLLGYLYGGIVTSGITYTLSGVVMKDKGPVFVTAFNPLSMIITAVLSSFIFAERMTLGKVSGAVVTVIGLYLIIWGKTKDKKEMGHIIQNQNTKLAATVDDSSAKGNKEDGSRKILDHNAAV